MPVNSSVEGNRSAKIERFVVVWIKIGHNDKAVNFDVNTMAFFLRCRKDGKPAVGVQNLTVHVPFRRIQS